MVKDRAKARRVVLEDFPVVASAGTAGFTITAGGGGGGGGGGVGGGEAGGGGGGGGIIIISSGLMSIS